MSRGSRRHLVTLYGPDAVTPLEPPDWWCAVQEATGLTLITGDYHPGITTATRLHHKGRIYQVEALANRDDRDVELTLTCREVFD